MGFLMFFQIGFKSVAFFTAISLLRNELKTSKLNKKQQKPYLVRDWMFLVGPRMVLPRGVCWYATACKWSKTTSCRFISTSCISRRITPRSRSISWTIWKKSILIVLFSLIKFYFRDELLAGAEKLHPRDDEYKLQILTLPRICFTTCVGNLPKDY
jgi:hypothetical protein